MVQRASSGTPWLSMVLEVKGVCAYRSRCAFARWGGLHKCLTHTYVGRKVLVSVAWEGGVRGVRACRPVNLFVVGLVALVCTCMYVFCVLWCGGICMYK